MQVAYDLTGPVRYLLRCCKGKEYVWEKKNTETQSKEYN